MHTTLCDLLGIDAPIMQAGMSVFTSAELVAAVSHAGGIGTLGAWRRPPDDLERQLDLMVALTDRPFAVNHVVPDLNEEAFALTLRRGPALVTLALGEPGTLVERCHGAGCLVAQQVTTVAQAIEAAELGVDIVIAQGSEAGGFGGEVAALPLVPQVVDAVAPTPVVASGGIADGRGIAAALALGAAGASVGTRFLASDEAPIGDGWKQLIAASSSEDAVKFHALNAINPVPGATGYGTTVRAIQTPFIEEWNARPGDAAAASERLDAQLRDAARAGRLHELMPGAGQSAGLVRDVLPAAEIVRSLVAETEATLERLAGER